MLARPTGHRCSFKGDFQMKWLFVFLFFTLPAHAQKTEKATFAAGCFWCTEEAFEKVPGVISAVSGYTGGTVKGPSYEQVSSGRTGHTEAVEVTLRPGLARAAGSLLPPRGPEPPRGGVKGEVEKEQPLPPAAAHADHEGRPVL